MSPSTEHVTILLSLHDGERWLDPLLESIRAQTHADWKLLVRDDGSSDRGPAIVAEHAATDPRIVPLTDDGRGPLGPAASYMALLEQVDRGWFAFCDQDDVWLPHKLSWSLAALIGAGERALAVTDAEITDAEGVTRRPSALAAHGARSQLSFGRLLVNNVAVGATMLGTHGLARAAIAAAAGRPVHMHDWWCVLVAAYAGEIVVVAAPTLRWRRHDHTVTGATPPSVRGRMRRRLDYLAWSVDAAGRLLGSDLEPAGRDVATAAEAMAAVDPHRPRVRAVRRAARAGVRAWTTRAEVGRLAAVVCRRWAE